jgi:hypothetical protein
MLILMEHSPRHNYYLLHAAASCWSRNSPHFMEPESSFPHSQVPAICPYLTLITTDFNNTRKLIFSSKYILIWFCSIMIRNNFSLYMYLTSVLRLYILIVTVSVKMCAVDTLIGTLGMEGGFGKDLTGSHFNFRYI